MKKLSLIISCLSCILLGLFLVLTLWDVTIHGWLEPADINVSHFYAGAGNRLAWRLVWGGTTGFLFLLWLPLSKSLKSVSFKILIILLIPLFLYFSAFKLERTAEGYSDVVFNELIDSFNDGNSITSHQAIERLGPPLFKGRQVSSVRPHEEAWLYIYMPSAGWGWRERVLYFDGAGFLCHFFSMDEP